MQTNSIKKIYFVLVVGYLAVACSQKSEVEMFIVSKKDSSTSRQPDSKMPPDPPAGKAYYFPINLIIDSSGQFFCYPKEINWNDDAVPLSDLPKFVGLKPADIIELPANNIDDFIRLNVLDKDTTKRYVAIISEKDTVQSKGLTKIIELCKNPANHVRWLFRLPTIEESIVLGYKKRQQYYFPDAIKWDSTKIQMPLNKALN